MMGASFGSVAEVGDDLTALEMISNSKPDALLLDWNLRDLSIIDVIR